MGKLLLEGRAVREKVPVDKDDMHLLNFKVTDQ